MLTQEQIQRYEQDGFLVVKQLFSVEQCENLKSVLHRMIDEWEPETDYSWMFPNGAKNGRSRAQRMMDSSDKISFSIEKGAVNPDTGKLNRSKHQSVSTICCALHKEPEFKKVAFSDQIKAILHDLNFIKPAIRQTMCIFKQPFIGGEWEAHRDSTYVYNDPFKVVGIWIALEDANIENGCLWFIPGSNSQTSPQRYIRNPNENFKEDEELIFIGEKEQFDDNAFVPAEMKTGDAVLIHGQVIHRSAENKSSVSRKIYAVHILETHNSVYSKENWLQPTEPFSLVYDE